VGELKARTERLAEFETLEDVDRVLERLCREAYVQRLARQPGQKEDRFSHLLSGDDAYMAPENEAARASAAVTPSGTDSDADARARDDLRPDLAARVAALEAEVAALRAELEASRPGSDS
jgi:uncharacterized protein YceH (UPF0502 family)